MLRIFFFLFLFLIKEGANKPLFATEKEAIYRISSQMLIRDYRAAMEECQNALHKYRDSLLLQRAQIKILAKQGKEEEALLFWKKGNFPLDDRELIETLAWGILEKSDYSSELIIPLAAMFGAFATSDVRTVAMLKKYLRSSNAFLRATAAKLSASYFDADLIVELERLLVKERVGFVRLEVIRSLGSMEVHTAREALQRLVLSPKSTLEERAIAMQAIVQMKEEIEEKELQVLLQAKRAPLRSLACDIIAHLNLVSELERLEPLLEDSCSTVRISALNAFYLIGLRYLSPKMMSCIEGRLTDSNPTVAITAAWIALRFAPDRALALLKKQVYGVDGRLRRIAAFAIANGGKAARMFALEVMKTSPDPFVRVNIALGLVSHSQLKKDVCNELYTFSLLCQERIMWETSENPLFSLLAPTKMRHIPQLPQYPLMVDQLTRLDILGTLAILGDLRSEEALKSFLSKSIFGITYTAANALIAEGGEKAREVLDRLLEEKEEGIRVQAALVLALSGKEPKAIKVLEEAYETMGREMKVNILSAIGHIGDKSSIPFLLQRLEEPYHVLKMIAASSLLQCVYH